MATLLTIASVIAEMAEKQVLQELVLRGALLQVAEATRRQVIETSQRHHVFLNRLEKQVGGDNLFDVLRYDLPALACVTDPGTRIAEEQTKPYERAKVVLAESAEPVLEVTLPGLVVGRRIGGQPQRLTGFETG